MIQNPVYNPAYPTVAQEALSAKIRELIEVVNAYAPQGLRLLGNLGSTSALPTNASAGDAYTVNGTLYAYNGSSWVALSAVNTSVRFAGDNMVINSYFPDAVNQRAWVSGDPVAAQTYFLDRWVTENDMSPVLNEQGISFAEGWIQQRLEKGTLAGQTVTAAIGCYDGSIAVKSGVMPTSADYANFIDVTAGNGARVIVTNASASRYRVRVASNNNPVMWVAVYLGGYTIDTLPQYQPRGYARELMDCKRYFRRLHGLAHGFTTASKGYFDYNTDIPMRALPTVTQREENLVHVTGITFPAVTISCLASYLSAIRFSVEYDGQGSGINHQAAVCGMAVDLDAEI